MKYEKIMLEHGSGGLMTGELIKGTFLRHLANPHLELLEDSAILEVDGRRLCFTTDSFVVSPIFFPGGDIGSLAVHGTVNDLSVCGGRPLFLSAGFILEEGFSCSDLDRILRSMAAAAAQAGVRVVTGDTKVVPRGSGDGVFINTSGIGIVEYPGRLSVKAIEPGDVIIVNGTVGDHGAAILSARESPGPAVLSDSAPLNGMASEILKASRNIHCMRDATRGGLGAIMTEIAGASETCISIRERDIPVKEAVRGLCEILGFDPLFLASEGKMAVFCPGEDADRVLGAMRSHDLGRESAIIGEVLGKAQPGKGRAILRTVIGGERVLDLPTGELVPRIC